MNFLTKMAKKIASHILLSLFYAYTFCLLFIKNFKKTTLLQLSSRSPGQCNRFAIFAVYCEKIGRNQKNIIKKLAENNYYIIVLNNGKLSQEELEKINADVYIERPEIGRDWGLYQYAAQWLYKNVNIPNEGQVLFMNDSIFYLEGLCPDLFERISRMQQDCIAIADIKTISYHMASWLFVLSGKAFKHEKIQNFWNQYIPLDFKRHCVQQGEVGFTSVVQRAGYTPYIIYPSSHFINNILDDGNIEKAWRVFPKDVLMPPALSFSDDTKLPAKRLSQEHEKEKLSQFFYDLSETKQQMHLFNLNGICFGSFPFLKKDLRWLEIYSLDQIYYALDYVKNRVKKEDITEIRTYYTKRGSAREKLSLVQRILVTKGFL